MLEFHPIRREDGDAIRPFLGKAHFLSCTQAFQTFYLWSGIYETRFCIEEGFLFLYSGKGNSYSFPFGSGDLTRAIDLLREHAHANGRKLRFYGLLREQMEWMQQHYPNEFSFVNDRDGAEYLYEAEKLMTYSGKKLHAKRNFCNRFEAAHPDWQFVPITAENLSLVQQMHSEWTLENEGTSEGLHQEGCVVRRALYELDALEMTGGVLLAEGRVWGFSVACMINDTVADINIEKAVSEEPGAYPMVCREMVRLMKQKYPTLQFVNREEDTGDEGLRQSKESYRPILLLEKFVTQEL